MKKRLLLLLPLLLVALAVGACETEVTVTAPPAAAVPPAGVLDRAPDIFTVEGWLDNVCAACHGPDLAGDVGPSLVDIGNKLTVDEVEAIINNGRHGTSMPAWSGTLTGEQINLLAEDICEIG